MKLTYMYRYIYFFTTAKESKVTGFSRACQINNAEKTTNNGKSYVCVFFRCTGLMKTLQIEKQKRDKAE